MDLTYLAGPMSGYVNGNYPQFMRTAANLRALGYSVINPADQHAFDESKAWDWFMRRDIPLLCKAAKIALLPGWQGSRGARLELRIAQDLGMSVLLPRDLDELGVL